MFRIIGLHLVFLVTLALTGCGSRPDETVLLPAPGKTSPAAQTMRMFVVTTRGRSTEQPLFFDNTRGVASHLSYDISIPPTHRAAQVEWPKGNSDPATDFVTLARRDYDAAGFQRALSDGRRKVDVSLYIHGYNNNFQESVYRATQIAVDAKAGSVPILFAWPSVASTAGYVADRDAADFSRAALAELIAELARNPRIGRVFVIGHSMGGRLTMEALMQLRLSGRRDVLNGIEVVLADPDIDQDLFWEQARIVGKLPLPISVIVAPDDRALRVSQILAAGRDRIGKADVSDPAIAQHADTLGVRIIDVTAMDTDAMAHNRIVQIASLYNELPASTGGVRRAGAFALGSIGVGMTRIGSDILDQ